MIKMTVKPVCVLFYCYIILLTGGVSGFTPVTYPARVSSECGQYDPLQDEQLTETLSQLDLNCVSQRNRSCQEILYCFPSALSGYYQITAPNGSLVQVYCDMEGTNCGGEGGWTRVTYVNMSQSGATCPQNLTQRLINGNNYCGRSIFAGCQSTIFSTHGLSYSRVCGRLRGYQYGAPDAFNAGIYYQYTSADSNYVDGVSITYGSNPRKHVWTYTSGVYEYLNYRYACPCNNGSSYQAPSFVGGDYYCESGRATATQHELFLSDLLWDGQQCTGLEGPCCTRPNMPWFNKTLSETTTENIELRQCGDGSPITDEDVPIELIELYIR